jgi:hypothetical protein
VILTPRIYAKTMTNSVKVYRSRSGVLRGILALTVLGSKTGMGIFCIGSGSSKVRHEQRSFEFLDLMRYEILCQLLANFGGNSL